MAKPLGNPAYPYTHTHIVVVHGIGDQAPNETALNFMNHFLRALPRGSHYRVEVDNLIESVDDIVQVAPSGAPARSFHPAFLVFTSDLARQNYVIGFSEIYWQHITNACLARNGGRPPIPIFVWAHSINTRMLGQNYPFETYRDIIENLEKMLGLIRMLAVIFKKSELLLNILNRFFGDVQMYTESDDIRAEINDRFRSVLSRVTWFAGRTVSKLPGARFTSTSPNVYVVAHSEGTVVAYTTLVDAAKKVEPWLDNVRGFVTLGSPLDKHFTIWRNRFSDGELTGPPRERKILWHNYWDQSDPVGYGLKALFADPQSDAHKLFDLRYDKGFTRYPIPGMAHVGYWSDPAMHEDIIHRVMQLVTTGPDTTVASKWWGQLLSIIDVLGHLFLRILTLVVASFFLYKLGKLPVQLWRGDGTPQISDALGYLIGLAVCILVWRLHTTVHRGLLQMWRYTKGTDTEVKILS
jgi:hypothetical protein